MATIAEIADEMDVHPSTARRRLEEMGLETHRTQVLREAGRARMRNAPTILRVCRFHGEIEHRRDTRGSYRCPKCNGDRVTRRRKEVKEILVAEMGGQCRMCGYDLCTRALEFHHVDPADKVFGVAFGGQTRSLERARAEASKCILLCSNCHMEVEAGVARLPDHVPETLG